MCAAFVTETTLNSVAAAATFRRWQKSVQPVSRSVRKAADHVRPLARRFAGFRNVADASSQFIEAAERLLQLLEVVFARTRLGPGARPELDAASVILHDAGHSN